MQILEIQLDIFGCANLDSPVLLPSLCFSIIRIVRLQGVLVRNQLSPLLLQVGAQRGARGEGRRAQRGRSAAQSGSSPSPTARCSCRRSDCRAGPGSVSLRSLWTTRPSSVSTGAGPSTSPRNPLPVLTELEAGGCIRQWFVGTYSGASTVSDCLHNSGCL